MTSVLTERMRVQMMNLMKKGKKRRTTMLRIKGLSG